MELYQLFGSKNSLDYDIIVFVVGLVLTSQKMLDMKIKQILHNLKLMFTNLYIIIFMIVIGFILSISMGIIVSSIATTFVTYQLLYGDKKHYWNGSKHIDITKKDLNK